MNEKALKVAMAQALEAGNFAKVAEIANALSELQNSRAIARAEELNMLLLAYCAGENVVEFGDRDPREFVEELNNLPNQTFEYRIALIKRKKPGARRRSRGPGTGRSRPTELVGKKGSTGIAKLRDGASSRDSTCEKALELARELSLGKSTHDEYVDILKALSYPGTGFDRVRNEIRRNVPDLAEKYGF